MKKVIVLSIALITLFSCSKDEIPETPKVPETPKTPETPETPDETTKNLILGTWYKFSFKDNEVSNCEKESTFQFNEGGTYEHTPYINYNNECIIDGESSGTWKYENGVYSFNDQIASIKFTDDNKTLILGEGSNEKLVYKREKTLTLEPEQKELLMGIWYVFSRNGEKADYCERNSTLEFQPEGGCIIKEFASYKTKCNEKETVTSTWNYNGDGTYTINNTKHIVNYTDNNTTLNITYVKDERLTLILKREIENPTIPIEKDPLVGEWYLFSEKGIEVDECKKKSTLKFTKEGILASIGYITDNNECVFGYEINGVWKNLEEGKYFVEHDNTTREYLFKFSDNNNTLKVVEEDIIYKRK